MRSYYYATFILLIGLLFQSTANAQPHYTEVQLYMADDGFTEYFGSTFLTKPLNDSWGTWAFAGVTPEWGEILAGISRSFNFHNTFLELGVGAGIEQHDDIWRIGVSGFGQNRNTSLLLFYEYGASGYWYLGVLNHDIESDVVGVGIHAQRFNGIGPRLQVKYNRVKLWGGYLYDPEAERYGGVLAVNLGF